MISTILTPVTLWKDFVIDCSFKENYLDEIECDGVVYKNLYFSGRSSLEGDVRIFAVFAQPKFEKTDRCIVLVGEPSKKIDFDKIRFFTSMGYSVIAPDLRGISTEINFTKYPSDIPYANYEVVKQNIFGVPETVKQTAWYEWACVVRYTVEFAKSVLKMIKVALVGVKAGADIAWMSITDEIDCFVDFLGAGWNGYKDAKDDRSLLSEQMRKYVAGIDAESYAQYVNCPVLFLTATNNTDFDCEKCTETITRIKGEKYFVYSAGYRHFLNRRSLVTVGRFLDKYLDKQKFYFYKSPVLSVNVKEGKVVFDVDVDKPRRIKTIWLYVCCGNGASYKKNWRSFKMDGTSVTISDSEFYDVINAFVSIKYNDGTALCTSIVKRPVFNHKKTLTKSISLSDNTDNAFSCLKPTDKIVAGLFHSGEAKVMVEQGPFGILGLYSGGDLISYKLNDFASLLNENVMIKFDIYCPSFEQMKIGLETEIGNEIKTYYCSVSLKGANVWQKFCENLSAFKDENGIPIKDFSTVFALTIESEEKYLINNFILF